MGGSEDPTTYARSVLYGEVMDDLVQGMLDHAVPPIFLRHDHSASLQRAYDRAVETMRAAVDQLEEPVRIGLRDGLHWFLQEGDLSLSLVEQATHGLYFDIPDSVFDSAAHSDSRLFRHLPGLADGLDDDGLLRCEGREISDQTLFEGDWAVHYHQLLRRHFTSHINDSLIGVLIGATNSNTKLRLALDDRRLRSRSEFSPYSEKDFWYGPPLSEELLDGMHSGGRTVYAAPEGDWSFDGYDKCIAIWYEDGPDRKTMQMEETIRLDADGTTATSHRGSCHYVLLRYLHSIRDTKSHEFIHCDGAVRAYTDATYAQRVQSDWSDEVRADRYRKLFRLDGHISTVTWSEIVARWFRHNRLVLEYLNTLSPAQS